MYFLILILKVIDDRSDQFSIVSGAILLTILYVSLDFLVFKQFANIQQIGKQRVECVECALPGIADISAYSHHTDCSITR